MFAVLEQRAMPSFWLDAAGELAGETLIASLTALLQVRGFVTPQIPVDVGRLALDKPQSHRMRKPYIAPWSLVLRSASRFCLVSL